MRNKSMSNKFFAIALGGMLALGANAALNAQDQTPARLRHRIRQLHPAASSRASGATVTGAPWIPTGSSRI